MTISIPSSSSDVLKMASQTAVGRRMIEEREALMDTVASEATPLLSKADNQLEAAPDPDGAEDVKMVVMAWQELKHIVSLAMYSLSSQVFEHSISIVPIVSLGHLSLQSLAATTLGTLVVSITGFSVLGGLAGALDSILPAAYASENKKLVGLWCQRMGVTLLIVTVPILIIWNSAHYAFTALNQEPEVTQLAATYLHWYSLGLPAYGFNLISRRYLEIQGLASVQSQIVAYAGTINMVLSYGLVYGPKFINLGFIGGPLASVISYWLISLATVIYAAFWMKGETWPRFWEKEVCAEILKFEAYGMLVRRGIAGVGHSAAKNWAHDIVGLAVALLGPIALGTQSVLFSTASLFSQIWVGLGNVTTTRIEHLLHNEKPRRARIGTTLALMIAVAVSFVTMTLVLSSRDILPRIFTSNLQVGLMVLTTLPIMCLLHIADSTVHIAGGVLRGTGDQRYLSLASAGGFYVVGLPLGLYLAFSPRHQLGVCGLWLGNLVAVVCSGAVGVWMCLRMDWERAVTRVREGVGERERWVVGDDVVEGRGIGA